jgi:hypothetical protein
MERSADAVAPRIHTISVQYAAVNGADSFVLDDWTLDVEYWRQT